MAFTKSQCRVHPQRWIDQTEKTIHCSLFVQFNFTFMFLQNEKKKKNSCLGFPSSVIYLSEKLGKGNGFVKLKQEAVFVLPRYGCFVLLLTYQQHNCSFRVRRSKKQQILLAVGKNTPRKKRIYPYSNKRDKKQSYIHLSSFPSQKSLPVKLTLFKAPSRAQFPIQTFRKPYLERGAQPVRGTESSRVCVVILSIAEEEERYWDYTISHLILNA